MRQQWHSGAASDTLRSDLLSWWQANGRHWIPWKLRPDGHAPSAGEVLDPWPILVAEVMLQQTQLQVVLPYWQRWMAAFTSPEALAAASEHEVLLLWQGLGYYSRARRLQQGARQLLAAGQAIPERQASVTGAEIWPRDLDGWLALPGVGRSTAASILSSAFDLPHPILDGNVKRVLTRLIASPRPPARDGARLWQLSEALLDARRPRAFNQALMDLGALVCTPRNPGCGACPWQPHCAAYAAGDPSAHPVKDTPRELPFQVIGVGVVLNASGQVLIDQRLNEGLLGGLWEFPGGKQEPGEAIEATIARELREELAIEVAVGQQLIVVDHAYSHRKLRFVVHLCRWRSGEPRPLASQQVRWVDPARLDAYPFPAANTRIIAALLQHLQPEGGTEPAAQVICLGEALIDRLGPPGGDPAMDGGASEDRLGGAPANVACALARLGTPSAFVGRLGRDAIGDAFRDLLRARGVDQSALQHDDQRPSRIVLVRRDAGGERQFGGFAGDRGAGFADQALEASALALTLPPLLARARWLLLGTISLASPSAAAAAWQAIDQARAAGVAIAVDVNWRPTFWDPGADPAAAPTPLQRQRLWPLLEQADLLKCAAEEAFWLFGSTDPALVSAALPLRPLVVVTDGAATLRWAQAGGQAGALRPFAVAVVDSTGAGDAFMAGLLHGLCAGGMEDLAATMRSASACGALVCRGAGAIDPQPTPAELQAYLVSAL